MIPFLCFDTGTRETTVSKTVSIATSHRPPKAGQRHTHTHFLAMIHIPCYMYDTSTVTLGSRTPHLPNGAFCSHSGLLWKDPTKDEDPERFVSLFFSFFPPLFVVVIEKRQLAPRWRLHEHYWKNIVDLGVIPAVAICSADTKFRTSFLLCCKLSDRSISFFSRLCHPACLG